MELSIWILSEQLLYFVLEHSFELREVLVCVLDQLAHIGRRWVALGAYRAVENKHVDPDVGGPQRLFAHDHFAPDRVVCWGYHLMSCYLNRHIRQNLHGNWNLFPAGDSQDPALPERLDGARRAVPRKAGADDRPLNP